MATLQRTSGSGQLDTGLLPQNARRALLDNEMQPIPETPRGPLKSLSKGDVIIYGLLGIALVTGGMGIWSFSRIRSPHKETLRFLVVGDWGAGGTANQSAVADAMAEVASQKPISFVVSTGNNFAAGGLQSSEDEAFSHSFTDVYHHPDLQVPWYSVLGPADYGRGAPCLPSAPNCTFGPLHQVGPRLVERDGRWICQRTFRLPLPSVDAELFFLDTSPFHSAYQSEAWASFPGGLSEQSWRAQVAEVGAQLVRSKASWKVVVGHHPIRSNLPDAAQAELVQMLEPVLEGHGVRAYIAGAHNLQHVRREGSDLHHLISGAGAGVQQAAPQVSPGSQGPQPAFPDSTDFSGSTLGLGHPEGPQGPTKPAEGTNGVPGFHAMGPGFMAAELDAEQRLGVQFYGLDADGSPQLLYGTTISLPRAALATDAGAGRSGTVPAGERSRVWAWPSWLMGDGSAEQTGRVRGGSLLGFQRAALLV
eukprot:jgi/Botrbrau1/1547/Bobra.0107s0035.1